MGEPHHNGDFAVYFRQKQAKLGIQDAKIEQHSSIFANCRVYINGNTSPPALVLKKLVLENGGTICAFFGRKSAATHVVAAHITHQKVSNLKHHRVVTPQWITESVRLNRLQDWTKFRTVEDPSALFFKSKDEEDASDAEALPADEELDRRPGQVSGEKPSADPGEPLPAKDNTGVIDLPGPEGDQARIDWIQAQRLKTNCLDSEFIRQYFAESRLHYMSTRKLLLKNRCRAYTPPEAATAGNTVLMHVDYDCFFVSASLKIRPQLVDKPVCVSHGGASSDIASCNYVARSFGVRNGMWVGHARQLCPNLVCIPFDFEEYTRCSDILYDSLLALKPLAIAAISLDEAMVDISNLPGPTDAICGRVRATIKERAQIDVSIGVGPNIMLAKLALKHAKPRGQIALTAADIATFAARDLPGVGRHVASKLEELGVQNIGDIAAIPPLRFDSLVGKVLGRRLRAYANGNDSSDISTLDVPVRSIGIEIGWAVRVLNDSEKSLFLDRCCEELHGRLTLVSVACESLTVKLYRRAAGARFISTKHLGHGVCDIVSKAKKVCSRVSLAELIDDVHLLAAQIPCAPMDLRGVGLHMKVKESLNQAVQSPHGPQMDSKQTRIELKSFQKPTTPRTPKRLAHQQSPFQAPRAPKKRATLTQFLKPDVLDYDPAILAELPSQIRREILLFEDDYEQSSQNNVALFTESDFMGLTSVEQIRRVVHEWISVTAAPAAQDARAFLHFIKVTASDDSSWSRASKLVDWVGIQLRNTDNEDWLYFYETLKIELQTQLSARFEASSLF